MKKMFASVLILLMMFMVLPAYAETEGHTYYKAGVFAYEDGAYQDAEKDLQKALDFEPTNLLYHHYLGKTYLKMERYQDAEYHLNLVQIADPNIPGFQYDWGFVKYQKGKYADAAKIFRKVAKKDPSNALAHYHAGMSLFKMKNYRKALKYLLKSADMSAAIKTNADYHAGVCYWNTGSASNAIERFEYVRDHAKTEELRANALNWLRTSETEKPKKASRPYSLYLKFGYQYDDNVRLEPLDQEDEGDSKFEWYFSGKYNFVHQKDLKVGAGYSQYQSLHSELSQYNMTGSILKLYTTYRFEPFTVGFTYSPSFFWVDSESYLDRHQLKPELTWRASENLFTRFSYTYNNNDYSDDVVFEDNDPRDGDSHGINWDAYYSILNERGYVFGGIGYEGNSASRSDESYGMFSMKLGLSFELPWEVTFNIMGRYQDKTYDDKHHRHKVERDDGKYLCAVSLSRNIYENWLGVLAEFDYTKNDSNIKDYEYDRSVMGISLTASY